MVIDIFNPSVPMSTYLSAFMVADFGHTTNEDDENYNIFHIKSKAEQAKYAASIGPSILEFYESINLSIGFLRLFNLIYYSLPIY